MNVNYFLFSHLYFNRKPNLKAASTINIKFANNDWHWLVSHLLFPVVSSISPVALTRFAHFAKYCISALPKFALITLKQNLFARVFFTWLSCSYNIVLYNHLNVCTINLISYISIFQQSFPAFDVIFLYWSAYCSKRIQAVDIWTCVVSLDHHNLCLIVKLPSPSHAQFFFHPFLSTLSACHKWCWRLRISCW